MTLRLTRLDANLPITADGVGPHTRFMQVDQKVKESIEAAFNSLEDQVAAIAAAQAAAAAANAAAANANAAADAVTSESSLVNSFIVGDSFIPPLISADAAGNITIADHDRKYGDGTEVSVTGATFATVSAPTNVVRVYYTDPPRAGGAVSYLYTVDPDNPPVQGGDIHSVGAVTIPGAGTQSGNYVQPPGTVEP